MYATRKVQVCDLISPVLFGFLAFSPLYVALLSGRWSSISENCLKTTVLILACFGVSLFVRPIFRPRRSSDLWQWPKIGHVCVHRFRCSTGLSMCHFYFLSSQKHHTHTWISCNNVTIHNFAIHSLKALPKLPKKVQKLVALVKHCLKKYILVPKEYCIIQGTVHSGLFFLKGQKCTSTVPLVLRVYIIIACASYCNVREFENTAYMHACTTLPEVNKLFLDWSETALWSPLYYILSIYNMICV